MKKIIGVVALGLILLLSISSPILGETTVYTEEELKSVEKAGTYPVKVYVEEDGKQVEQIIYVTVTLPGTEVQGEEAINGDNFSVDVSEMKGLSAQELIERGKAYAWRTSDGAVVPIQKVEVTNDHISEGYYDVSYQTEKGTTKSVRATIGEGAFSQNFYITKGAENAWGNSYFIIFSFLIILLLICPVVLSVIAYILTQRQLKKVSDVILPKSHKKDN